MGRALASFKAEGWDDTIPHTVDYRTGNFSHGIGWDLSGNLEILNIAIKEWSNGLSVDEPLTLKPILASLIPLDLSSWR